MLAGVIVSGMLLAGMALAAEGKGNGWGARDGKALGIVGTVASVSGTSLSMTSKSFGPNAATTTYAVDASNAAVVKDGATATLASIAVGDRVIVRGTVSGASIAATVIRDDVPMRGNGEFGKRPQGQVPPIQGNGEPVVGGNVTAINGTTLTVTNRSSVIYTVDASNAKVVKENAASSIGSVAVGDSILVQGVVNGRTVTANTVIDQGAPKTPSTNVSTGNEGFVGKIFGGIGGFFKKLFGF